MAFLMLDLYYTSSYVTTHTLPDLMLFKNPSRRETEHFYCGFNTVGYLVWILLICNLMRDCPSAMAKILFGELDTTNLFQI